MDTSPSPSPSTSASGTRPGPPPPGGRIVRAWRRGPSGLLGYARHRLSEAWWEWRLRIRTAERTRDVRRVEDGSLWKNYAPVPYRSFYRVLRQIEIRPGVDVFVDYGAGKGRTLVLAARHPFRRVLGVEVVPEFAEEARRNLERAQRRSSARTGNRSGCLAGGGVPVEIVTADAAEYGVPDDATILHLFDPFAGRTLERWIDLLEASLRRSPRRLTILYADDHHFAPLADARPWLHRIARVPWTWAEGQYPERCAYAIYEAGAVDEAAAGTAVAVAAEAVSAESTGTVAPADRGAYPARVDRRRVVRYRMSDRRNDSFVPGSPAMRIALVWPLTLEAASLSARVDAERRLQRHVTRLERRRG